jgi:CDP-4-dehydro-6-deoxyglucose reductase
VTYCVTISGAGQSFHVEAGESVLAAALRENVNLAHDCKSGTCGTCRMRLVEGAFSYRDEPMGISPEETAEGYLLACQARPDSDLVVEAEMLPAVAAEPRRLSASVRSIEAFSPSVAHMTLELPGVDSFAFLPGQHVSVLLDDGRPRSFSMASPPHRNLIDFHVRRIPGGVFTDGRLTALSPGDTLDVELPLGSFFLRKEDFRPLLMVATGTGLAPIKSMLGALMDDPDCPPVTLIWGGRTLDDLYLDAEIRTWAERLCDFRYFPVLSRADSAWEGRRGHVQDVALAEIEDLSEPSIYLCGSPVMVAEAKSRFAAAGASLNHIYADSFLFQHNR